MEEPLGYRPALDGLRAVAVIIVVAHHLNQRVFAGDLDIPGGFLGVDLFFVLSGFLITRLMLEEWSSTRTVSLRAFWIRRAIRLLPPLLALLVGVWIAAVWLESFRTQLASRTITTVLYVGNWQPMIEQGGALGHLWSLSVEEQFYVIWPLAFLGLMRFGTRRAVVGAVAVLVMLMAATSIRYRLGDRDLYYGTEAHGAVLLVAGAVLAFVLPLPTRLTSRAATAVGCASATILGYLVVRCGFSWGYYYATGYAVLAVPCVALIVAALTPGPVRSALSVRPLALTGRASYAIYLWHWPAVVAADELVDSTLGATALALAVTALATAASWRFVEMPSKRLRRFAARR